MGDLPICMSVKLVHSWCLWRPEEGVQFSGAKVTDVCELSYVY